jgi:hypothetical protein
MARGNYQAETQKMFEAERLSMDEIYFNEDEQSWWVLLKGEGYVNVNEWNVYPWEATPTSRCRQMDENEEFINIRAIQKRNAERMEEFTESVEREGRE